MDVRQAKVTGKLPPVDTNTLERSSITAKVGFPPLDGSVHSALLFPSCSSPGTNYTTDTAPFVWRVGAARQRKQGRSGQGGSRVCAGAVHARLEMKSQSPRGQLLCARVHASESFGRKSWWAEINGDFTIWKSSLAHSALRSADPRFNSSTPQGTEREREREREGER